jgi:hypothetical protein
MIVYQARCKTIHDTHPGFGQRYRTYFVADNNVQAIYNYYHGHMHILRNVWIVPGTIDPSED